MKTSPETTRASNVLPGIGGQRAVGDVLVVRDPVVVAIARALLAARATPGGFGAADAKTVKVVGALTPSMPGAPACVACAVY